MAVLDSTPITIDEEVLVNTLKAKKLERSDLEKVEGILDTKI